MERLKLNIKDKLTLRSEEGDYIEIDTFINVLNETINEIEEEIERLERKMKNKEEQK